MKKTLALTLSAILCLFLCACGETPSAPDSSQTPVSSDAPVQSGEPASEPAVLVAAELAPASCEPERSIKTFQDIAAFLGRRIDTWTETYRLFQVTEEDGAAVAEYVRLLIDEFDYEIVGGTNFDINAPDPFCGKFMYGNWEVMLGLSTVDTGRETRGYIDKTTPCDICLHGNDDGEFMMTFTDLFHTEDFGYRWSGNQGDRFKEIYGQRALDAYYLENGRYYNGSDGVLSVEAGTNGEAVILINGEKVLYSTDAGVGEENYSDYPHDDYSMGIYRFLDSEDSEEINITVPKTLLGGEVYTLSDGLGRLGDSPIWAGYIPGEGDPVWSSDVPTPRCAMNACTVRVLRWDEVECVVYIAMDIVTELEPMTVEVLTAMPAPGSLRGDTFKAEEAVTLKVGESLVLEYNGPYVFMPNYETYEWKLSSGQGAAITGSGDKCTVTAASPGQIIVKCVYSYGKDQPDVLTGIPQNENHTKSKLYYIDIVE